jgi:hypothetical protein
MTDTDYAAQLATEKDANFRRVRTAFHESAHAVVGVVLGLPMVDVSIVPDDSDGTLGRVRFGKFHETQRRERMLMIAAGPEAAIRLVGRHRLEGEETDREQLRALVDEELAEIKRRGLLQVFDKERRIANVLKRSAQLVEKHWEWISRVAFELYHHQNTLTCSEVKALRYASSRRNAS